MAWIYRKAPAARGAPRPRRRRGDRPHQRPGRLRATAAALAASAPPDPDALAERERRQWGMLTAQLFGTGRQWRPLDQALALLWRADAWREELRQLLLLLAERADHRLHPLPGRFRCPLDPPRRRAPAPEQRHRPALHHPAQKRSPLLPLHPLPPPGPRSLLYERAQRKQDGRPGGPTGP
ncbi:MAG: hypothetical protein ACK6BG_05390 [Cyanobacteriota bacterium]